jgi:hypothetical protein
MLAAVGDILFEIAHFILVPSEVGVAYSLYAKVWFFSLDGTTKCQSAQNPVEEHRAPP